MQIQMRIVSVTVPQSADVVVIDVDLGIPGASGQFRFTAQQAKDLGRDLIAAAQSIPSKGRHFVLQADPGEFSADDFLKAHMSRD